MNCYGRITTASAIAFLTQFVIVHGYIDTFTPVAISERKVPVEIKYWDTKRSPLSHMVDVTNEFGLKILAEHSFLNDNNLAFSPYGLMGILVALYEGVDGEASYQIQRSMQLPWNRNVMRIGFRDIHRSLKTYFVPEEGFLAGLALNNENVTFTNGYKKILRFYGFDLDKEEITTPAPVSNTTLKDTNGPEETFTSMPTEGTTNSDTTVQSTIKDAKDMEQITSETRETTTPTTISLETSSDTTIKSTTETVTQTNTLSQTSQSTPSSTGADEQTTMFTLESSTEPSTVAMNEEPINIDVDILSTETTIPSEPNTMSLTSQTTADTSSTVTDTTETTTAALDMSTIQTNESTLETLERRKKSIVDFIFTSPPDVDEVVYRSFDIGSDLVETYDTDKDFLANGLRSIQVSYMHYDTVLDYAYLPHLEAAALRLPLDSDRYYMLVVLPVRVGAGELGRLLARMARESDLSDVYAALRPRRVKGIVPSFTVKGHVILTTDLQKLGIRDVFEPRQRDFTPMTPQSGVYVRSIEQAVSVTIRKYQPDQIKHGFVSKKSPVVFSATYPFLYFVMDSNIHVALMAGKLMDPLNTRIL